MTPLWLQCIGKWRTIMPPTQNTDANHQLRKAGVINPEDPGKQKAAEELVETLGGSRDCLIKASTAFPIFPDTISVDRAKITITRRNFMQAGEVVSIAIEDVLNVSARVGPFFGRLKITTRFFDPNKAYVVDGFWREDALRIARVVQGYLIAKQKEIDTSALSDKELSRILNDLGKSHPQDRI